MTRKTGLHRHLSTFATSEDGAVTVDWVVLTAAVVMMAFGAFVLVRDGAVSLGTKTGTELATTDVPGTGF
jgi:hypothetical protein